MFTNLNSNIDKIRVLLVDDDESDGLLFKSKIKQLSNPDRYAIDIVNTYDDAVTTINDGQHDIYFIDYTLNTEDGMSLIKTSVTKGHKGPFVLLAGTDRPDLYQQSSKSGVFDYLLKNEITPSALERTITYTIERNNIQSELMNEKKLGPKYHSRGSIYRHAYRLRWFYSIN